MSVLGNENYMKAATQMVSACGAELSHWTRALGHVCGADKVGNFIETCATLLTEDGSWDEMCSLLHYLAFQDVGGLATIVAGHRVGVVCDQAAPPPGQPPPVECPAGAPLDTVPAPALCAPAVGAGQLPSVVGGPAAALPTGGGGRPLAGSTVKAPFGGPPGRDYVMGSFASCERDPQAWRDWPIWHAGLRPLRFTAVGMGLEFLDASPDDVAELKADLASPLVTAVVFDSKHRIRVGRVWAAEVPEKADLIHAQLGVGFWANGSIAPGGWGLLRSGRAHRFKYPWVPEEFEAAAERNGPGRSPDAPLGTRAQVRVAEKAAAAAAQGSLGGPAGPCSVGAAGACQPGDMAAGASEGVDLTSGAATLPAGCAGPTTHDSVPPCWHDCPAGPATIASCTGCQAYGLTVLAAGREPPRHFPGDFRCGHPMDSIALDCHVCAEHVDDVVGAIGGAGPALAVATGIGGPLLPDLSSCVRANPGIYVLESRVGWARA